MILIASADSANPAKSRTPTLRIGDLVDDVHTWNPSTDATGSDIDYIDIGSVDQSAKQVVARPKIAAADAPSRARQLVKAGDILVSTVRPNLNSVALVPDNLDGATASTGFCVLRPKKETLSTRYLFQWVKTPLFIGAMSKLATGQSYPAVSDRIILDSQIPLPTFPEQRRIAAILDAADALRQKRRLALCLLDELSQSIFIEMFGDPVSNPKEWDEKSTLGDCADIASGVTKGRNLNGKPSREVPYLAVYNVQDKALKLDQVKTIDATDDEIERYSLRKHDLLLTEGGDPDKLGRGTLWNDELPECIHQNHVFRVRLHSKDIEPFYLNWLVGSQRGKKYFLRSAKQTTGIASINMTQLRAFPLLIPPIKLQREFRDRIGSLNSTVVRTAAHAASIEALFATFQHRAFRGEL